MSMRTRHVLEGYTFVFPWILGFVLFMGFPLATSLIYSVQKLSWKKEGGGLEGMWIGLQNYREAFTTDVNFLPILLRTVGSMLLTLPFILVFSMIVAILLNRNMKGQTFFRGVFFLPVIIASGQVLQKLVDQGAANMQIFQISPMIRFVFSLLPMQLLEPLFPVLNQVTLIMWDSGVQIIIFLAGLQTISSHLYEAARCDGATPWEAFWKITFPLIAPMILVNTLYTIVNSFTKVGNPMMVYVKDAFLKHQKFGYAAAAGWIYFIVIFLLIALVLFLFRNANQAADGRR